LNFNYKYILSLNFL